MARKKFRRANRLGAMTEINITPLIDLAFALLIIFMITTPLLEQSIRLDLPEESQKPQNAPVESPFRTISIDAEGRVHWDGEPVSEERIDELLENAAAQPDPPVLRIRADRSLRYQSVVAVIDRIKSRGLTKISLDTQAK